jgi:adenylate kinase family enzyme
LRSIADSEPKPGTKNFAIKEAISAGEMVTKSSLDKLIETNILQLMDKKGIIIDGYPRDMKQVMEFEQKVFFQMKYENLFKK